MKYAKVHSNSNLLNRDRFASQTAGVARVATKNRAHLLPERKSLTTTSK